jgi:hypothetical protein
MRNLRWVFWISLGLSWACGSETPQGMNPSTGLGGTGAVPPKAGTSAPPGSGGGGAVTASAGRGPVSGGTAGTGRSGAAGTGTAVVAGTSAPTTATAGTVATTAAAGTSAAAGTGGAVTAGTGAPPASAGSCGPPNMNPPATLDMMGPWAPMHVERTGPTGASWIFFPAELGKDGMKHPVFDWGPGAGTGPDSYVDHLNLVASQGFVVISQASTNSGKAALDWILMENEKADSMWYQKLDTTRVGRGGHSMGALQSFTEADDPRLTLYVLVCGGGGGGTGAANIHAPSIFLGGEGEGGTTQFAGDYAAIDTEPSVFVTKTDTDHIYCARNNLAPWIAFMRWTWCGDTQYKQEFLDGGTYCKAPWLDCQTKNLP